MVVVHDKEALELGRGVVEVVHDEEALELGRGVVEAVHDEEAPELGRGVVVGGGDWVAVGCSSSSLRLYMWW